MLLIDRQSETYYCCYFNIHDLMCFISNINNKAIQTYGFLSFLEMIDWF
jgi:hypothetical protein